jgi:hypothetical protein
MATKRLRLNPASGFTLLVLKPTSIMSSADRLRHSCFPSRGRNHRLARPPAWVMWTEPRSARRLKRRVPETFNPSRPTRVYLAAEPAEVKPIASTLAIAASVALGVGLMVLAGHARRGRRPGDALSKHCLVDVTRTG